jgi:DNA (cytosine-5)-methyltransferase 1
MNHGSLFSGIGGFDLAAEWMGWNNIFHCEWNPFGQKVLKHHFPNSISYHDITKTDFTIHRGNIDILTGGFPCQPYSSAGLRLGKADERHLFPQMLRAIKEIQPRWVIGENVRGLVSWNEGMVFNEVYADLESEGYEVQSFLIPAAGVNAPHQRFRVWFVAHANDKGRSSQSNDIQKKNGEVSQRNDNAEFGNTNSINATDTSSIGLCGDSTREQSFSETSRTQFGMGKENATNTDQIGLSTEMEDGKLGGKVRPIKRDERDQWNSFPTQPALCGGDDGLPKELDGISLPKWRKESIMAYGNAIVPQVAHNIFKTIEEFERIQF